MNGNFKNNFRPIKIPLHAGLVINLQETVMKLIWVMLITFCLQDCKTKSDQGELRPPGLVGGVVKGANYMLRECLLP